MGLRFPTCVCNEFEERHRINDVHTLRVRFVGTDGWSDWGAELLSSSSESSSMIYRRAFLLLSEILLLAMISSSSISSTVTRFRLLCTLSGTVFKGRISAIYNVVRIKNTKDVYWRRTSWFVTSWSDSDVSVQLSESSLAAKALSLDSDAAPSNVLS